MQLTFTDAAKKRLTRFLKPGKKMLLDYDDGVGPFSATGSCSMDNNFRLIFVDEADQYHDFDANFDSNLGPITYKGYTKPQLDEQMTVKFIPATFTMPLTTPHGLLTEDLEVIDWNDDHHQPGGANHTHDC